MYHDDAPNRIFLFHAQCPARGNPTSSIHRTGGHETLRQEEGFPARDQMYWLSNIMHHASPINAVTREHRDLRLSHAFDSLLSVKHGASVGLRSTLKT